MEKSDDASITRTVRAGEVMRFSAAPCGNRESNAASAKNAAAEPRAISFHGEASQNALPTAARASHGSRSRPTLWDTK